MLVVKLEVVLHEGKFKKSNEGFIGGFQASLWSEFVPRLLWLFDPHGDVNVGVQQIYIECDQMAVHWYYPGVSDYYLCKYLYFHSCIKSAMY